MDWKKVKDAIMKELGGCKTPQITFQHATTVWFRMGEESYTCRVTPVTGLLKKHSIRKEACNG